MIQRVLSLAFGLSILTLTGASRLEAVCLTLDGETGALPGGWTVNYHNGSPALPFTVVDPTAVPFSPTPPNPVPGAHSGTYSVYMGDPGTGQYVDYLDVTLESPTFTASIGDTVRFWERVDVEPSYDYVTLEIYQVSAPSGYAPLYSETANNWDWKHRWAPIPAVYAGLDIKVVFRFTSDYVVSQYMGWLLDDIYIGQDNACSVSPNCGNGTLNAPFESCDDGNTASGDGCSAECVTECGDAALQGAEVCDDGFENGFLGQPCRCNATCTGYTQPAVCGDGWLCGSELCDDGASNGTPCYCNATCDGTTPTTCGDGWVCDLEICDSGAANGSPCNCNATCDGYTPTTCGDGAICDGEWCDDGATNGTPCFCDATCMAYTPTTCGDGWTCDGEWCDDGLSNGACGFCNGTCSNWTGVCGDGTVECGEACDDGINNGQCGFCDFSCAGIYNGTCGNWVTECSETCDDGNTVPGDGCSDLCQNEGCGDGVIQSGPPSYERCDDGGTLPGDGCDDACQRECSEYDRFLYNFNDGLTGAWSVVDEGGGSPLLWNISPAGAFDTQGWRTGEDPNDYYQDFANTSLYSPFITLPAAGGYYAAAFWENINVENGYDFVELRVSQGVVTDVLYTLTGSNGGWQERWVDLTPYAGMTIQLVFNFQSDYVVSNYPGWKIDDLRIQGCHNCGNGAIEGFETCDDTNSLPGDGCDADCIDENCGNGFHQPALGELCDDGNLINGDGCDDLCQLECGNGSLEGAEQCDDGNLINGDGCNMYCQTECGNGLLDGGEQCDDGNTVSGDGCDAFCQSECGNGALDGGETCDDSNTLPGDGCDEFCQLECGNGLLDPALEQCDDGNQADGDGCSSSCLWEGCGNGLVEAGTPWFEQCDDGGICSDNSATCNMNDLSACLDPPTASCLPQAGDGCDLACQRECVYRPLGQWDFEDAGTLGGWNHGPGGANPVDLWHLSTSGFPTGQGFRWSAQGTGLYENNRNNILYSPLIVFDPAQGPYRVAFDMRCEFDFMDSVELKAISQWGGTSFVLDTYNYDSGGWMLVDLPLTLPAGNYYIAWHAMSDASIVQGGFWLDNVSISNCTICGDGALQTGELCDDGNMAGGDGCDGACVPEVCGNGILQPALGETCDDGNTANGDGCDGACQLECGNGALDGAEFCDDGNVDDCAGPCNADCTAAVTGCGDGVLCAPELCDDGNAASGDGCDDTCLLEYCGDSTVNNGEECDDGGTVPGDGCDSACVSEVCGNGVFQSGEQCDDGNTAPDDGCGPACEFEYCGDGFTQPGQLEECDDGGNAPGDGCGPSCVFEVCGNGIIGHMPDGLGGWIPEECDDGNLLDGDGCSSGCLIEFCGDTIAQPGLPRLEQCDDGNLDNGDGCDDQCKTEVCGNGVLQPLLLEQCDDGNLIDGDGCSSICETERCGDGDVDAQTGEDCDDGGLCSDLSTPCTSDADCGPFVPCAPQSYDGCSDKCRFETCGSGTVGIYFNVGAGWINEQCDDGGLCSDNAAPCTIEDKSSCASPATATCDPQSGDGCNSQCFLEFCGDGVLEPALGEECDDGCTGGPGNPPGCDFLASTGGDGCDASCRLEQCGNGVLGYSFNPLVGVSLPEDCDDGNTVGGDGCDANCRHEPQLFISSSPPGASIYIHGHPNYPGVLLGQTPPSGFFSPPFFFEKGFVDLTLHLPLFAPVSRRVFLHQSNVHFHADLVLKTPETYLLADQLHNSAGVPLNVGSDAFPALIDWNCDGTLDVMVGRGDGTIEIFPNFSDVGLAIGASMFVEANYGAGNLYLDVGDRARTAPVDFNSDGLMDLIVGNSAGEIYLFRNSSGVSCNAVMDAYEAIQADGTAMQVSGEASPAVADIDGDGLFDLLIGSSDGEIRYFHNSGTPAIPLFDAPISLFPARAYAVQPAVADFNADGHPDLYVNNNTCGFDVHPNRGLADIMDKFDGPFPMVFPLDDMVYTQLCQILPSDATFGIGNNLAMTGADLIKDPFYGRDLIIGDDAGNLFLMQTTHMAGDINNDKNSNGLDVIQVSHCLDEAIDNSQTVSLDARQHRCRQADVPPPVTTLGQDRFGDYDNAINSGDRERIRGFFGSNYLSGYCGNGLVDPGEDCDAGGICSDNGAPCRRSVSACANSATAQCLPNGLCSDNGAACVPDNALCADPFSASCVPSVSGGCGADCRFLCGDGTIDFGESCDDGNQSPGDGCDSYCQVECGNGVIDVATGCSAAAGDGSCLETCDDGGVCVTQGSVINCASNDDCPSGEECRPVGYPFTPGDLRCVDAEKGWCSANWPCPSGQICVATGFDGCSADCGSLTLDRLDTVLGNSIFCTAQVDVLEYGLSSKASSLRLRLRFYAANPALYPFNLAFNMDTDQNPVTGLPVNLLGNLSPLGNDTALLLNNVRWEGGWVSDGVRLAGYPQFLDAAFFGGSVGVNEWELQAIISYSKLGLPSFGEFNYVGFVADDPQGVNLCDQFPAPGIAPFARSNPFEYCGNGVLDPGEGCDDGNNAPYNPASGDTCTASCFVPVCGDGRLQIESGETCDGGGVCSDNGNPCRPDNLNACANPGTATCILGTPGMCDNACQVLQEY